MGEIHHASYILVANSTPRKQTQPADLGSKQRLLRLTSSRGLLSGQRGADVYFFF